jgi:hypothetical protein
MKTLPWGCVAEDGQECLHPDHVTLTSTRAIEPDPLVRSNSGTSMLPWDHAPIR